MPLVAVLMLFVAGCSKSESFNLGEVKDGKYHNAFFGMTVTLPEGWTTAKTNAGNKTNSVYLFSVSTGRVDGNAIITGIATEDVREGNAEDYLEGIKQFMEDTGKNAHVVQDITSEVIGGKQFKVMAYDVTDGWNTVHQKLHTTVINGHGLGLETGYLNDEDKPTLDAVIQSITFEQ